MIDHLHDLIDSREEGREEARAIVERHIKESLPALLQEQTARGAEGDPVEAMRGLIEAVSHDLDPLTTKRVRVGFELERRK